MKSDEPMIDERLLPGAQARAWLVRLKSGDATQRDLQALGRWRASSEVHEASYQNELRMWQALGPALAGRAKSASPALSAPMSRRWVLGGAGAVAASAVAGIVLVGVHPAPAGATVFETSKGERRTVQLAAGLGMTLNTDSRIYFWPGAAPRLTLDRGEAMISVAYPEDRHLLARSNLVEVTARKARFVLRDDNGVTKIACLDGDVSVRSGGKGYALGADRALVLGEDAAAEPMAVVAAESEAGWQRGVYVFKDRPAAEVVGELNRYRPGHVYLPGGRGAARISGVIHLDRVDLAVDHIARSLGMQVVRLPGGVVFLRG